MWPAASTNRNPWKGFSLSDPKLYCSLCGLKKTGERERERSGEEREVFAYLAETTLFRSFGSQLIHKRRHNQTVNQQLRRRRMETERERRRRRRWEGASPLLHNRRVIQSKNSNSVIINVQRIRNGLSGISIATAIDPGRGPIDRSTLRSSWA